MSDLVERLLHFPSSCTPTEAADRILALEARIVALAAMPLPTHADLLVLGVNFATAIAMHGTTHQKRRDGWLEVANVLAVLALLYAAGTFD